MALTDGTSGRNMHQRHWAEPGLASECRLHQSKGWSLTGNSVNSLDGQTMDLLYTTHFPVCVSHGHPTGIWVDRETVKNGLALTEHRSHKASKGGEEHQVEWFPSCLHAPLHHSQPYEGNRSPGVSGEHISRI